MLRPGPARRLRDVPQSPLCRLPTRQRQLLRVCLARRCRNHDRIHNRDWGLIRVRVHPAVLGLLPMTNLRRLNSQRLEQPYSRPLPGQPSASTAV